MSPCRVCLSVFAVLVLLLAVGMTVMAFTFSYPWHAQCKINWEIGEACSTVKADLVNQINTWTNNSCPGTSSQCPKMPCGQKCKYKLLSAEGYYISVDHTTPNDKYVDHLDITLTDDGKNCKGEGLSRSNTWYAILDYGTNYCNLRNLMDGAGISDLPNFNETTNDAHCTQYSDRDCSRF